MPRRLSLALIRTMTPKQAEALLRQEVASDSVVGKALLVLLEDAELQLYRQTARGTDPIVTATVCGRAQGVQHILKRIVPTAEQAPGDGSLPAP